MVNRELDRRLRLFGQPNCTREIVVFEELDDWVAYYTQWRQADNYPAERLACEKHLSRIVQRINVWDFLIDLYERSKPGAVPNMQVRERMKEVLPVLLPTITDYFVLNQMWDRVFTEWPYLHQERILIQGRMRELIRSVTVSDCPCWFLQLLEQDPIMCPVQWTLDRRVRELKEEMNIE